MCPRGTGHRCCRPPPCSDKSPTRERKWCREAGAWNRGGAAPAASGRSPAHTAAPSTEKLSSKGPVVSWPSLRGQLEFGRDVDRYVVGRIQRLDQRQRHHIVFREPGLRARAVPRSEE